MAAHPFGPIENFLFRTAKNLKSNEPERAKMVFISRKPARGPQTQEIRTDLRDHPKLLGRIIQDPSFQLNVTPNRNLERTAIVNSSDKDDEFLDLIHSEMDLLSRGLGYRITFTMPADKPFNKHDRTTWPEVELAILDILGLNVLRTACIPQGEDMNYYPTFLFTDRATPCRSVQFQQTVG